MKTQVRIIVGTALDVYFGRKPEDYIELLLNQPDKPRKTELLSRRTLSYKGGILGENMRIVEVSIDDKDIMDGIVEMEKSTFGRFVGVNLWILKPIVKFGRVFAVIEKGIVIGAAEFMVAFDRPEAFLYGFSVMEKYREQGIGTNLLFIVKIILKITE